MGPASKINVHRILALLSHDLIGAKKKIGITECGEKGLDTFSVLFLPLKITADSCLGQYRGALIIHRF